MVQVAIMIEVFRSLVWSGNDGYSDVIFLFNGAEEAILQASHGFLKHPWAGDAGVVINLEAAVAVDERFYFKQVRVINGLLRVTQLQCLILMAARYIRMYFSLESYTSGYRLPYFPRFWRYCGCRHGIRRRWLGISHLE